MDDYKKELEEFVYVVSHDLNAPLRHIRQFGGLLINKLGDKVSEDEKEYLHYMEKAVVKAESMLEALLVYSRLNTDAETLLSFDCNTLVRDLLSDFDSKDQASITLGELPENLTAKRTQIHQLFSHLLDNAFKFKKPGIPLKLNIAAKLQQDQWHFSIQDNGIGIRPEQIEHVFTIFRRVHNENEYSGIGAGLAIAKKIVCQHNGKIWIESSPDGTTIFFTLKRIRSVSA